MERNHRGKNADYHHAKRLGCWAYVCYSDISQILITGMTEPPQQQLEALLDQARRLQGGGTALPVSTRHVRGRRSSVEPFSVYRALFPVRIRAIWWIALLMGPAGIAIFSTLPGGVPFPAQLCLWSAAVVAAARLIAGLLVWLLQFWRFRSWRRRLMQLRIEGWETLVSAERFGDRRYWRQQCRIHLHLLSSGRWDNEALQTLLLMFRIEANQCAYPARSDQGPDPRYEWIMEDNTLSGSVNCQVARQIYELCQHLAVLNRVEPTVESVLITVSDTVYRVAPFRSIQAI